MPEPAPRLAGVTPQVDHQIPRPRQRIHVLPLPFDWDPPRGSRRASSRWTLPRSSLSSHRRDRG